MGTKSVKKNTILNGFRMALTVLVPLITFPYCSRIFLAEGMGQINFAQSITNTFTLFASLGIYTYGVREGAKVGGDKSLFSSFATQILTINLTSTLFTYIVFVVCLFTVPKFGAYKLLLLIYGITIGFAALGLDWVYGAYEEYAYITKRQILVQVFTLAALFLLVHKRDDIYIWAAISVISNVGANVFNIIYAKKYITFRSSRIELRSLVPHITPILILFATRLASVVYANIDSILLGFMTTDTSVGLYAAAVKINTILITFFSAMSPVFVPRIVEYLGNKEWDNYYIFLKKAFALVLMVGIPAVIGLELLSEEVIMVLSGAAFLNAVTTMRILTPIVLINTIAGVFYYDFLVPRKKEKYVLICTAIAALVNVIVSASCIPVWSQNGAAIGSLIAEIIGLFTVLYISLREDKKLIRSLPNPIKYLIGSIVMAATIYLLKITIDSIIIRLVAAIVTGVCVYFLMILLMKDNYAVEAKDWALSLLKRRIRK